MIDANEGLSELNSGISKLFTKTQMCDLICLHHGSETKPNTYARGSKRIDFIFYTSTISQFIIRSGIFPFDSVTTTDHRVLYIDIILKWYFLDSHQLINASQTRKLQCRFTKSVLVYRKGLFKYVKEQQTTKSIDLIKNKLKPKTLKIEDMKIINSIDKKMTTGMLALKKWIQFKSKSHPWSPTLSYTMLGLHLWKLISSEFLSKTNKLEKTRFYHR